MAEAPTREEYERLAGLVEDLSQSQAKLVTALETEKQRSDDMASQLVYLKALVDAREQDILELSKASGCPITITAVAPPGKTLSPLEKAGQLANAAPLKAPRRASGPKRKAAPSRRRGSAASAADAIAVERPPDASISEADVAKAEAAASSPSAAAASSSPSRPAGGAMMGMPPGGLGMLAGGIGSVKLKKSKSPPAQPKKDSEEESKPAFGLGMLKKSSANTPVKSVAAPEEQKPAWMQKKKSSAKTPVKSAAAPEEKKPAWMQKLSSAGSVNRDLPKMTLDDDDDDVINTIGWGGRKQQTQESPAAIGGAAIGPGLLKKSGGANRRHSVGPGRGRGFGGSLKGPLKLGGRGNMFDESLKPAGGRGSSSPKLSPTNKGRGRGAAASGGAGRGAAGRGKK